MIEFKRKLPFENYEEDALQMISEIFPSWNIEQVRFHKFTVGLTNTLFGCSPAGDERRMVLFRVYGEGTERFINRQNEKISMMCLESAGLAAPLRATFANGLIYNYVPGVVVDRDMVRRADIFPLVATAMAQFHRVKAPPMTTLNSAKPDAVHYSDDAQACIWSMIDQCLELVPQRFDNTTTQKRFESNVRSRDDLWAELRWLRRLLLPLAGRLVFCHNDVLLNNILLLSQDRTRGENVDGDECGGDRGGSGSDRGGSSGDRGGSGGEYNRAALIDFEYAGVNYQAFDIGNHFTEFAGTDDFDYSYYPDATEQKKWIRCYLQTYLSEDLSRAGPVRDDDVDILYVQVNKFALLAHFYWGVWALVQARFSKIDYDFMNFAIQRFKEYDRRRDEFASLQLPSHLQFDHLFNHHH